MEMDYRYRTPEEIAVRLRELRAAAGMTIAELAEHTGEQEEWLSRAEATGALSTRTLLAYCDAFSVGADSILSTEPSMREKFGITDETPEPIRRSVEILEELIEDYFGLEALVGSPAGYRERVL